MLKSMGKKKLLTLVAVMAVAVTALGSFAAWDVLTKDYTSTDTVTLRNPVTVETTSFTVTKDDATLGAQPKINATAIFTLKGYDAATMNFTASNIQIMDGNTEVTGKFNLDNANPTATIGTGDNPTATVPIGATVKDDTAAADLAGKALTVKVKGTVASN